MLKRDNTLDLLRIASMFLVIVIHVANCFCRDYATISSMSYFFACLFNMLARVSVPIFFMISGALLIGKKQTKEKYLKRIIKMVIVLAIWTFVYYIWEILYLGNTPNNIFSLLYGPDRAMLWFMYAIIALYIALPFIHKMMKNLTKKEEDLFIILWLFFSGVSYIFKLIVSPESEYPIPIVSGTYYLGYFIIGHILYKRINKFKDKEKLKEYNKPLLLVFGISNVIMLIATLIGSEVINGYFDKLFAYRNIFLVLSSISVYLLVLINFKYEVKWLDKIAPYSLGIYLVHGIILNIFYYELGFTNLPALITIPVISIMLFGIAYGLIYLLKKIPKLNEYIC